MSDVVFAAAGQRRFTTLVMSFFAGVAFFLGALGLYGILALNVEQRIRKSASVSRWAPADARSSD